MMHLRKCEMRRVEADENQAHGIMSVGFGVGPVARRGGTPRILRQTGWHNLRRTRRKPLPAGRRTKILCVVQQIYPMTTHCQCGGIIKFRFGSARATEKFDRHEYDDETEAHPAATNLYRMSLACSTSSSDTHSSRVWAWAMSPGPKTTAGIPAAASGAAWVP